ncbi:hypothetical protein EYC80_001062 [Monilinia laxa]|uniref:Uncharacterized protein n=1 Tax=Monilinia laxa TaxID=61186 RepID=A0A5N6K860_MONLA|nr:hypothetical protein EYC80_001062 [Monilinia laxa]
MSHIFAGLPSQITWTTKSIAGPISLYLVPAEVPDIGASISTIGIQIPNYGIYEWVPSQTLSTVESCFSILMVDSDGFMTVLGTFLIDGLQSSQPNIELRRRDGVHVANFRYRAGESSGDSSRDSGYKISSSELLNSGKEKENNRSNHTEMKTINPEKEKTSKSAALDTDLSTCSPLITRTEYVYMGATSVPNNNENSPGGSKLKARFASSNSCSDKESKGRNGSCNPLVSRSNEVSLPNGTTIAKSSSQSSAHNSGSKGNHGSKSSSSGDGSKESNDSSDHESGSKESKNHGSGTDSDHKSGHESNSKHKNTPTRTDCTLVTTTTIIYIPSSKKAHTHYTKTYESASAKEKTTLLTTNSSPSESLTSITLTSPSIFLATTSFKPSTTSLPDLSTTAISIPQISQIPQTSSLSPFPPQSSTTSNTLETISAPSVDNTPSTSTTPDTSPPPSTQRMPPVIITTLYSAPSSTFSTPTLSTSAYGNLTIYNTKSGTAVPVFTGGANSNLARFVLGDQRYLDPCLAVQKDHGGPFGPIISSAKTQHNQVQGLDKELLELFDRNHSIHRLFTPNETQLLNYFTS